MRKSKFTKEVKIEILLEKENTNKNDEEIFGEDGISFPTYYNWKRELFNQDSNDSRTLEPVDLKKENLILRNLYINLSEHNYQLAKFLSK